MTATLPTIAVGIDRRFIREIFLPLKDNPQKARRIILCAPMPILRVTLRGRDGIEAKAIHGLN